MITNRKKHISILLILLAVFAMPAQAAVFTQFTPDTDPNDTDGDGNSVNDNVFLHLAAGDGFSNMADGKLQYIFGFSDVAAIEDDMVMEQAMLGANLPSPTIVLREGQNVYLNLSNVGMVVRPDLFDPHSVHFHGFPNAASVFDGVPESSAVINMGSTFTYFYKIVEPGTFIYHCHVEATEHMEMGMVGNLWVTPIQNQLANGEDLNGFTHETGFKYAYNDGDGSTYYDVESPIQITAFDPDFHDASLGIEPLPFALIRDRYPLCNGRGYPQTVDTNALPNSETGALTMPVHSLITATSGQKILLRMSNVSIAGYYTVSVQGIPMKVVAVGARILRGSSDADLSYTTSSVTLGGGETTDVILDTTGIPTGTYVLYTTNLNYLSNDKEDFGGLMTEIRIN